MTTKLELYNLSLGKLGTGAKVASLTESSAQRIALDMAFAICVPMLLRVHPWAFATKRVVLTDMDNTTPIPPEMTAAGIAQGMDRTEWGYRYLYPSDCLAIREICPDGTMFWGAGQKVPFEVGLVAGNTSSTRAIYTNLPEAQCLYTADVSGALEVWDPLTMNALAYGMAAEVAFTLTGKPEIQQAVADLYRRALNSAAAGNLNEGCAADEPVTGFLGAR